MTVLILESGEKLASGQMLEKGDLTPEKAKKILRDGTVYGKPLTDQQKKFFGAIAGGEAPQQKSQAPTSPEEEEKQEERREEKQDPAPPPLPATKKSWDPTHEFEGIDALAAFAKGGGMYIGPRGGKWADPEHTIPYKEGKYLGKAKFAKEMRRRRKEGAVVSGPKTFEYKEIIKSAGGVWDSWKKQWLVPDKQVKTKLDEYMARGGRVTGSRTATTPIGEPSPKPKPKAKLKPESPEAVEDSGRTPAGILQEAQDEHDRKNQEPPTKADVQQLVDAAESVRALENGTLILGSKLGLVGFVWEGRLTPHGKKDLAKLNRVEVAILTDACLSLADRLPAIKEKAAQQKARDMAKVDVRRKAAKAEREKKEEADLAAGKLRIGCGQGYGGHAYRVGEVFNHPDHGLVSVVTQGKVYYPDDGLSFGVGDESGYVFYATVRKASPREQEPYLKAKAAKELRREQGRRVEKLGRMIQDKGEHPEGSFTLKGDKLFESDIAQRMYGGGTWFVVEPDDKTVWFVRNNGGDGDAWGHNNVRTGGAGAIGWRLEDAKLAAELKKLAKAVKEK